MQRRNTSTKHTKSLNVYFKYNESSTAINIRIRRSSIHSPTPPTNTLSNGSVSTADKSKQVVRKNSTHTHQVPKFKSSSRAPMLVHALDEASFKFQYHKPALDTSFHLPPTRAKTPISSID